MKLDAPGAVVVDHKEELKDWQKKQREFEQVKARAKELRLRLTCTICGEKAKLNCPCGTTQYCSTECQRIDWRDRGHRKACKKIRNERAAEAARAEAPTPPPPPEQVFYGPAPRSHADEVRARIAAEHEAARVRREANPEPVPLSARFGSRCPICMEEWDVHGFRTFQCCCARMICNSCTDNIDASRPCPLCQAPALKSKSDELEALRRHVENDVPEAINFLGRAYHRGLLGVTKSMKKAKRCYKRAAELGDLDAMSFLAGMYHDGQGVEPDIKKATRLYQIASDGGHAGAQNNFAVLFESTGNEQMAGRYYKLAAEQGLAPAEYMMGIYRWEGRGMDRDLEEAKRWFTSAAAKGYEDAKKALVYMARRPSGPRQEER